MAAAQQRSSDRMKEKTGLTVRESPEDAAIRALFQDKFASLSASRLLGQRIEGPLFSVEDLADTIPSAIRILEQSKGEELNDEERAFIERMVKASLNSMIKAVSAMTPADRQPYDEQWRMINAIVDLAVERGISPEELLSSDQGSDELVRRTYTKKEYFDLFSSAIDIFFNAETLKMIYIDSLLDSLGCEGEDRREMEEEIAADILPEIQKAAEQGKAAYAACIKEEIERIFGS